MTDPRTGLRLVLLAGVAVLGSQVAARAADVPLPGKLLLVKDTKVAKVISKATGTPFTVPAFGGPTDPTANPSSLLIDDLGGAGALTEADLATGSWRALGNPPGSRGYVYTNPAARAGADPVKKVVVKSQIIKVIAKDDGTLDGPVGGAVEMFLTLGSDTYCARFGGTTVKRTTRFVRRRDAAAPADCSVPPPAACGNGVAEAPPEECDDGGTSAGDGCDAACQLESANPAPCAGVPSTSGTALDSVLVASGLSSPVHVTAPRLDPNRVFIVEQGGTIRIVENGVLLPTPFLDLSDDVPDTISCCGEQGLFALAFHPDYETNGLFYVSYTAPASGSTGCVNLGAGDNVLARFQVSTNPNVANERSKVELLRVPQPFPNHNGGNIVFGPGGFLYMGIGDGGSGGDTCEAAQNPATALGKLLRVDVTATPPIDPVSVVWARGLRNPWRFSFDRGTNDLYVGDVGQNAWEEVTVVGAPVPANIDYQWDDQEGRRCFEPMVGCLTDGTPPALEYCNFDNPNPTCSSDPMAVPAHQAGCSVTGGSVYRGCAMPDVAGQYFYSDICSGFIRSFEGVVGGNAQNLADHTADVDPPGSLNIGGVSSFGEDARGELYIVDYGGGEVFKLVPGS